MTQNWTLASEAGRSIGQGLTNLGTSIEKAAMSIANALEVKHADQNSGGSKED